MAIAEGEATHVLDITPRVNQGLLAQMEDRISKSHPSTLASETRTNRKRCIFRLPEKLKTINGKSFEPQVVALGPYHHGKPHLHNMEELKWRCLASFMKSRKKGKLEECLKELGQLEMEVRECYSESETIKLISSDELLQMMVVDGCFILMLFFRDNLNLTELDRHERPTSNNPLYGLDMVILPKIYRDLILLENQVPSCVLEKLYAICFNISSRKSLLVIATNFLCSISSIPESRNMPTHGLDWLHLLDLVRSILISRHHNKKIWRTCEYRQFSPIPCVTKLCRAGIKVKRRMANTSFLDVKFENGVIRMPDIILDDSMCSTLVNCVAYEQLCNISKHFSIYTTLLDCLVNTARDIDYLCDQGVVGNFIGTDTEAAQFINNLGRGLIIHKYRGDNYDFLDVSGEDHGDNYYFYLVDVFENINKYYRKGLNWGKWTSFKSEYFGKPWLLISVFVGFVLLVLSFLQTYYTIPKN
jgi:hypothetical protein